MGGLNGSPIFTFLQVVIKVEWGRSSACVQGNASMVGWRCEVVMHEVCYRLTYTNQLQGT